MNYSQYHLTWKEKGKVLFIVLALSAVISFLFYQSAWAMLLAPFFYFLIKKRVKEKKKEECLRQLQEHFMNGMQVLNASLQAGLSMENAWREVEKETSVLYGEKSPFLREIKEINKSVTFNMPIERLFLDFAYRTGAEDIISFAEIFDYGKRSGGNWKQIIEVTVLRMTERYETQREIEVMLAAKRMEQQVMNFVPLGMLLFLQISSGDHMQILYGNLLGVICMTVCLVGYGAAIMLSEKIMKIQV